MNLKNTVKYILLVTLYLVKYTRGECNGQSAVKYELVDEANYERNYSGIATAGTRPLGFIKGTWYYNQDKPVPCVQIKCAANQEIEILIEAIPAAKLCPTLNKEQLTCSDPGTGHLFLCKPCIASENYIEFTGDTAAESDVQFWYRLTLGPELDPEDQWCPGRTEEYPTSLKTLPPNYPINTESDFSKNVSIQKHSCLALFFFALMFANICL